MSLLRLVLDIGQAIASAGVDDIANIGVLAMAGEKLRVKVVDVGELQALRFVACH